MLAIIFFGWPAILVALGLSIAGILAKRPLLMVLGAIIFTPPALYLSGYPALRWFGWFLPVCLAAGAYALKKHKPWIAWLLTFPALAVSAWLAVLVLTQ